jgi:hypothetical protein
MRLNQAFSLNFALSLRNDRIENYSVILPAAAAAAAVTAASN